MTALLVCGVLLVAAGAQAPTPGAGDRPTARPDTVAPAVAPGGDTERDSLTMPPTRLVEPPGLETISSLAQAIVGVGLLVFAAVQVWLQLRESRDRRRAAFSSVYAEAERVEHLRQAWGKADLVANAQDGLLRPEELLPRDWGTLVKLFGEVGSGTAVMGANAFRTLEEAVSQARLLEYRAGKLREQAQSWPSIERRIKSLLDEAALMMRDALHSAPGKLWKHPVDIRDPESEFGKRLQKHMLEHGGKLLE